MNYPGGKNGGGAFQKIICQMPPHDVYIEPFLGSGAVLRNKKPACINIGIDKDTAVVDAADYAVRMEMDAIKRFKYKVALDLVVIHGCGIQFLESYKWKGRELVYCEPPYLLSTRRRRSPIYLHEFSEEDHKRLLSIIKRIPAMVMVSGYASELYARELHGWRCIEFEMMTRGGKLATECLWMNYKEPLELHDYRYLGENRTERQRIKRKCERWSKKLQHMPLLERQALLAAIEQMKSR